MENQKKNGLDNEIIETRRLVIEREHGALLVWGVTSAVIAMLIYVVELTFHDYYWWLWIALPIIALPIHASADRKAVSKYGIREFTSLYQLLGRVSKVTLTVVSVTSLLGLFFEFNAYFVILLILSIWCGLSGFMLDYKGLLYMAAAGLVFSVMVRAGSVDVLPMFAGGLCAVTVVPGLDMLRRLKRGNY